ncbi:MAG TPA: choice-of-anchor tandem repeat GloVer-containing protein [Chthonomonadaceae bacterium]|nr:choice-of-anchor tandem repeat GloVer-containing protein [Chthonomonadaceae bacterium]
MSRFLSVFAASTSLVGACLALSLVSVRPAQAQLPNELLYSYAGQATRGYATCRLTLGPDGNFYGTTFQNGKYGDGMLFRVSPSGQLTDLHDFTNGNDGSYPESGVLFDREGNLYGDNTSGGPTNSGSVYKYSLATKTFTLLHRFNFWDGCGSNGLTLVGHSLYGVTYVGGANFYGEVYRIDLPTATRPLKFEVLHSFSGSDGSVPWGPLAAGSDGNLYGTTSDFASWGLGTVFKITPAGDYTLLHAFSGPDGAYPIAGMTEGSDGLLYGTAVHGGPGYYLDGGNGAVFKMRQDGSDFHILHAFDGSDGRGPVCVLQQASDGLLYGTTAAGGFREVGTVFRLNADGSVFDVIHDFHHYVKDADHPLAGVVEGPDGNFYGATGSGGAYGAGAVYMVPTHLPIITSFSPPTTRASAGTSVIITGVNLDSISSVTIAGVSQSILSVSATTVTFQLNTATPAGAYPIVVTTLQGSSTSARKFTVKP